MAVVWNRTLNTCKVGLCFCRWVFEAADAVKPSGCGAAGWACLGLLAPYTKVTSPSQADIGSRLLSPSLGAVERSSLVIL